MPARTGASKPPSTRDDGAAARLAAARACRAVLDNGQSLGQASSEHWKGMATSQDRALARRITLEVMRWLPRLEWLLSELLKRPLPRRERLVHFLLLGGLAQLETLRLAPHGVVHATVQAARMARQERLTGLVNGVLKGYLRQQETLSGQMPETDSLRYGLPEWMIKRLRSDWPEHWSAIASASNETPPLWLRVNRQRTSRDDYLKALEAEGIGSHSVSGLPDGLVLDQRMAIGRLPGWDAGKVSVQDGGAQVATDWVDPADGMRILDACAAPGGKACHLLERAEVDLVAVESDSTRTGRIEENLQRLGLSAQVVTADAADVDAWWDGRLFDRVLVDAPCSSTGVLRRHPEIRWLRRESDLAEYEQVQARLLNKLWPLVKPGGMLVYVTCSVFHSENAAQTRRFVQTHDDARPDEPPGAIGEPAGEGRQILPGHDGMDGFYLARFVRTASGQ